jgi:hypothetical protein
MTSYEQVLARIDAMGLSAAETEWLLADMAVTTPDLMQRALDLLEQRRANLAGIPAEDVQAAAERRPTDPDEIAEASA